VACDNRGIRLHLVAACANDHDSPLLEPTLVGIVEMIGPLPLWGFRTPFLPPTSGDGHPQAVRHDRRQQRPVLLWGRTFNDSRLAAAVVDRLSFRAHTSSSPAPTPTGCARPPPRKGNSC
jgi:hypothetical protein